MHADFATIAPKHGSLLNEAAIVPHKNHLKLALECECAHSLKELSAAVRHRFEVKKGPHPASSTSVRLMFSVFVYFSKNFIIPRFSFMYRL